MAPVPKKGPNPVKGKKSDYYVKDSSLIKPTTSRNDSLRYKALQDKVFYFDFKNTSTAAWLEKEIRKLGGRVDYFFGKEVKYLITDKPQTREAAIPPCSPFSNGPSPRFSRPDTSQSLRDIGPSPSEWAYSEQWKKPQASSQHSRANRMMELASITKSQGSCDVLLRARERGTVIKTVEQITSWLNTVHKKLGTKLSQESLKETPKNPSRKLRGQYVKIQDKSNKYKPQVLESSQWQTIDCNLLTDKTPFNTEKRRLTRMQANELHKPETAKNSLKSILKKEAKNVKGSDKGLIRRKGGGKCEGCNVRFDKLEAHLAGEQHIKYAKKDKTFEGIDLLIADGLQLDTFLKENETKAKNVKKAVLQMQVLSPNIQSEGSTDTLDVDGPCTRARKHKYHCQQTDAASLAIPVFPKTTAGDPSPKIGVPEIENNYYLRSTPRKLVGLLDHWDTLEDLITPHKSGCNAGDRTLLRELQCQSLDLYSSQGQVTTQGDEYNTTTAPLAHSPTLQTTSRSRNNSAKLDSPAKRKNSPANSHVNSPAKLINSPAKRSPRRKDPPAVKRRIVNHS